MLRWFCGLALIGLVFHPASAAKVQLNPSNWGLEAGKECVKCHTKTSAGIVVQWQESAHGKEGVNCLDCHQADASDPDAIEHEGMTIATIVSPKDCGRCHSVETEQNSGSVHANAVGLIANRQSALVSSLGGEALLAAGCAQCHGSRVKVKGDGTLDHSSWPNSGIGRINPDGSKGSCSSCHGRHAFSKAQAREPAACIVCHSGIDSPDKVVYEDSNHGRAYATQREKMNLSSDSWVAGKDYAAAPTCVTCHMGAAGKLPSTHDVGIRDAWKLNSPVSERQHLVVFEDGDKLNLPESQPVPERGSTLTKIDGGEGKVKMVIPPDRRRKAMTVVCLECHAKQTVNNFMAQFDSLVELYNEKYAKPAQAIMAALYDKGLLTPTPFDEPLELTYWQLWHDEGIQARHGAAMASSNQAWGEGLYRVGKTFYGTFLQQVKALGEQGQAVVREHVKEQPHHQWLNQVDKPSTILGVANAKSKE